MKRTTGTWQVHLVKGIVYLAAAAVIAAVIGVLR